MPLFQRILVAVDFSEASKEAFRVACSLAHQGKTRVLVLNVSEPHWVAQEPVYHSQAAVQFARAAREEVVVEASIQKLLDAYAPVRPIDVEYRTSEGQVATEVLRNAADAGCDLIVMGTHGRTGIRRLLAGSVAEGVLRNARCAVMALRGSEAERGLREVGTILCPTDFSECSEAAIKVARSLAREHGARLILLNVVPTVVFFNEPSALVMEPGLFQAVLDESQTELEGADLKIPIETRMGNGDAASVILEAAKDTECDMIVMGTHGRSGLGRALMGSVTEAVLRKATCPLLAVKSAEAMPAATPSQTVDTVNVH